MPFHAKYQCKVQKSNAYKNVFFPNILQTDSKRTPIDPNIKMLNFTGKINMFTAGRRGKKKFWLLQLISLFEITEQGLSFYSTHSFKLQSGRNSCIIQGVVALTDSQLLAISLGITSVTKLDLTVVLLPNEFFFNMRQTEWLVAQSFVLPRHPRSLCCPFLDQHSQDGNNREQWLLRNRICVLHNLRLSC